MNLVPSMAARIQSAAIAVVIFLTNLSGAAGAAHETTAHASTGLRMGDSTVEGFADFLVPLVERGHGVLLVNPRFSLRDEGETQASLGLVWRTWLPDANVVIGANAWLDSRRSRHGNRFNQAGLGLELLGEHVDARVNWYDADNDPAIAGEFATREVATRTEVSDWRDVSIRREIDVDVDERVSSEVIGATDPGYGEPYGRDHTVLQDIEHDVTRRIDSERIVTTTTTEHRTVRTTRATQRFTTTTDRLFRRYEAAMDGFDAEIGVKLPLSDRAPEVRVFAGYYDFDNPYGDDLSGYKGRIEMRAGPYFTFDAEVFDDDRLNGTDYFVGFRLHVPLYGRDTWRKFREGVRGAASRSVVERRFSDMVMRDVRVQKAESEPEEVLARRRQRTEVETDRQVSESRSTTRSVSRSTRTTSEIATGTEVLETVTIADDVTFVDADNDSGEEDGTIEKPFRSLRDGIEDGAATGNNTIFLCEAGSGGLCDRAGGDSSYDEVVTLAQDQVLTSSIEAHDGHHFETVNRPVIAPSSPGPGPAVTLSTRTMIHRLRVDASGVNVMNAVGSLPGQDFPADRYTVTDNELITSGGTGATFSIAANEVDVVIRDNHVTGPAGAGIVATGSSSGTGSVVIDGNTVDALQTGIYTGIASGAVDITISGNTVTTLGSVARGIYDYPRFGTETTIDGNVVTTRGVNSTGILKMSSSESTSGTISGNTVVVNKAGGEAVYLGVANGFNTCNTVTGNDLTAASGTAIRVGALGIRGIQVSAADAAQLAAENTLNGGSVVDEGGVFGCTP